MTAQRGLLRSARWTRSFDHGREWRRCVCCKEFLRRHPGEGDDPVIVTVQEDAEHLALPRSAVELMARILAHMAAGRSVSVVPLHAELTTQQAADMVNVSRPFLVGLLDAGEIEYRMVGTHRRITASSLMDYHRRDDARRRSAADKLTALSQELGSTDATPRAGRANAKPSVAASA